ncbi:hypothetical protein ACFQXA_23515 [Nocardiopsis composta]
MAERKKILLRLDPAVHDALARWAGDELRSTNAQIEFLLRRALTDSGRMPRNAGAIPGAAGRPRSPTTRTGAPAEPAAKTAAGPPRNVTRGGPAAGRTGPAPTPVDLGVIGRSGTAHRHRSAGRERSIPTRSTAPAGHPAAAATALRRTAEEPVLPGRTARRGSRSKRYRPRRRKRRDHRG